jgi:hypothetical protein
VPSVSHAATPGNTFLPEFVGLVRDRWQARLLGVGTGERTGHVDEDEAAVPNSTGAVSAVEMDLS